MALTALLVIDAQAGFFEGVQAVHEGEAVLQRIQMLIAQARKANLPVIFVKHIEEPDYLGDIHPDITPQEGDIVIEKTTPDSFYETPLQETLTRLGVTKLVITGFQTEFCVDTTCRSAFGKKYEITLVKDGHSTFTFENSALTASQIIAHHTDVLQGFGKVIPAAEIQFTEAAS